MLEATAKLREMREKDLEAARVRDAKRAKREEAKEKKTRAELLDALQKLVEAGYDASKLRLGLLAAVLAWRNGGAVQKLTTETKPAALEEWARIGPKPRGRERAVRQKIQELEEAARREEAAAPADLDSDEDEEDDGMDL